MGSGIALAIPVSVTAVAVAITTITISISVAAIPVSLTGIPVSVITASVASRRNRFATNYDGVGQKTCRRVSDIEADVNRLSLTLFEGLGEGC